MDTIEQLILSRRGRGNIISYCYESKWNLPDEERQEKNSGQIYNRLEAIPLNLRGKVFDYSDEIYRLLNDYVIQRAIDALALIKPDFPIQDFGRVHCEAYGFLRSVAQENPEKEDVRRNMVFAQAVNAFLRHL